MWSLKRSQHFDGAAWIETAPSLRLSMNRPGCRSTSTVLRGLKLHAPRYGGNPRGCRSTLTVLRGLNLLSTQTECVYHTGSQHFDGAAWIETSWSGYCTPRPSKSQHFDGAAWIET